MKTHLYLIPGLSANCKIFKYLNFSKERFEVHCLEWLIPKSISETIESYALRMSQQIKGDNIVLIGVSFGGIIAQEISKIINPKKTIIIGSVKTKYELPNRILLARYTHIHKLFPAKQISLIENIAQFIRGKKAEKTIQKYREYLSVRNPLYLKWCLHQTVFWNQEKPIKNLIHIHSDADGIFPIKYIKNCIVLEGVPHVLMILKRAKTISAIISTYTDDEIYKQKKFPA